MPPTDPQFPTVDRDEVDHSAPFPGPTRRRWVRPLAVGILAAALAVSAAGCLAPAPDGPSPAVSRPPSRRRSGAPGPRPSRA